MVTGERLDLEKNTPFPEIREDSVAKFGGGSKESLGTTDIFL